MRNATDSPCDRGDDGVLLCPVCHDIQDLSDVGRSRRCSWRVVPLCMPQHTKLVGCRQMLPLVSAAHQSSMFRHTQQRRYHASLGLLIVPRRVVYALTCVIRQMCHALLPRVMMCFLMYVWTRVPQHLNWHCPSHLPRDHRCHSAKHISVCLHIQQPRCGGMPQRGCQTKLETRPARSVRPVAALRGRGLGQTPPADLN